MFDIRARALWTLVSANSPWTLISAHSPWTRECARTPWTLVRARREGTARARMLDMAADKVSGTLAAAVTPLRDGGERLDEEGFAPLLEFYGAAGLDGLLVLGTTGEGVLLGG